MAKFFETDYRSDRRKHSHRCQQCAKIVMQGERVVMVMLYKSSKVVHVGGCADKVADGINWRQRFTAW